MPTQIIECPSCSSLFCRDCPLYHKNVQLAKLSNFKPSCSVCLYRFSKTNLREGTKFQIDRNMKKLINEDISLYCRYHKEESCSMKEGNFETILMTHEQNCKACSDCSYLCNLQKTRPELKCECGQYYNERKMILHIKELEHNLKQQQEIKK